MLAACVGAAASGGVFKFVSSLHVEPAPGNETRGFHFVIAGPVTLWACGIRGELVAIDITNASAPAVVFDEQAPDPAGRAGLAHSRTLQWWGAARQARGQARKAFSWRAATSRSTTAPTAARRGAWRPSPSRRRGSARPVHNVGVAFGMGPDGHPVDHLTASVYYERAASIDFDAYEPSTPQQFAQLMLLFGPNNEHPSVFKPQAASQVQLRQRGAPGVPRRTKSSSGASLPADGHLQGW